MVVLEGIEVKLKKNRDEFKKWDNSIEGVLYELTVLGDVTTDDEETKHLVAETLLKLPKKIRKKVIEEVLFIIMGATGTMQKMRVTKIMKEKSVEKIKGTDNVFISIEQSVIVLNFSKVKSKKKRINAIAHEIAHFVSGDYSYNPRERNAEREADDLIEKWGFGRAYKEDEYKKFDAEIDRVKI